MPASIERTPKLIIGGMGAKVSGRHLAKAAAIAGQEYGEDVVDAHISQTGLIDTFLEDLQNPETREEIRSSMAAFPYQNIVDRIDNKYSDPKSVTPTYRDLLLGSDEEVRAAQEVAVVANFIEVYEAKNGHRGMIGANGLEKIQGVMPEQVLGAMLAGVDNISIGAGIPNQVPRLIRNLCRWESVDYLVDIANRDKEKLHRHLDPQDLLGDPPSSIKKPQFFVIASSHVLVKYMYNNVRNVEEELDVDGAILEHHTAGGHNAPPRGRKIELNQRNEPIYGVKDEVDYEELNKMGVRYWRAGTDQDTNASPEGLKEAIRRGAKGKQFGSIFALCNESGLIYKKEIIDKYLSGDYDVFTSPYSPTGYPFKVFHLENTLSDPEVYKGRRRKCGYFYLATPWVTSNGRLELLCPAQPVKFYTNMGGNLEDTISKICLCAGLLRSAGYGDVTKPGVITIGDDLSFLDRIPLDKNGGYSAAGALAYLLN